MSLTLSKNSGVAGAFTVTPTFLTITQKTKAKNHPTV